MSRPSDGYDASLTVRLDPEQLELLRALADVHECSVAAVVRVSIRDYLKEFQRSEVR